VVNESRVISPLVYSAREYGLTTIAVSKPFIEDNNSPKILSIFDALKIEFGQMIGYAILPQISGVADS
jgi:hypothetical protein